MAEQWGPPSVDFFGKLGVIGDSFAAARKDAERKALLANATAPDGSVDFSKVMSGALRSGDLHTATLAERAMQDRRDFQFRQDESRRAQGNADRTFSEGQRQFNIGADGQKTPQGFESDPNAPGGLRPKPGGPQDPAYIERTRKPNNLSVSDISKLSEEGGKFANLTGFVTTFKDDYAGRPFGVGAARNWVGRTLPEGVVDPKAAEGAGWWQGYDRFKNVVRNDLFGSALTVNEQAAFEKADINPGMNPDQIKRNLETQRQISEAGIKRKVSALVQGGYDAETVAKAYGVPLNQLGIQKKNAAPQQPAQQTAAPPMQGAQQAPDGKWYVPDPQRPGKYLMVQ